jgi:hypothetical protein
MFTLTNSLQTHICKNFSNPNCKKKYYIVNPQFNSAALGENVGIFFVAVHRDILLLYRTHEKKTMEKRNGGLASNDGTNM